MVAPPAGAWIETHNHCVYIWQKCVAPSPAGAWIETGGVDWD